MVCENCGAILDEDQLSNQYDEYYICPHCGEVNPFPGVEDDNNEGNNELSDDLVDNDGINSDDDIGVEVPSRDNPKKRRRPTFEELVGMDQEDDDLNDYESDSGVIRKKRKIGSSGSDDEDDLAIIPLQIGNNMNLLRLEERIFRFAFWNLENFTGDPIRQGPRLLQESITSDRNQVRIQFVCQTIVTMDLDCLALMELGSDAENLLRTMVGTLKELDPLSTWEFTMSEFTGSIMSPPNLLSLQFKAFGDTTQNIWAIETILRYYTITDITLGKRYAGRHLRAHQIIAWRSDHQRSSELVDLLAELKALEDELTHEIITKRVSDLIEEHLIESDAFDHEILIRLFTTDNDRLLHKTIIELAEHEQYYLIAIFLVLSGSSVELEKNHVVILTDGPNYALRSLGYNMARYERYGFLFRTGLFESYLRNNLVMTPLLQEGRSTNSRAAVSFRMPLGRGLSLGAYMIHSMYSPILGHDEVMTSRQSRDLRIQTLVAQAEHASNLDILDRPLFIFGDTNIDFKDIDRANEEMARFGYRRLGDVCRTTLRREGTLRSAFTRNGNFFSQPFDAVYQLESELEHHRTDISYPGHDIPAIQDIFLQLLSRSDAVRNWYFLQLKRRYESIYYRIGRVKGMQGQILRGAVGTAAQESKLTRDTPMSIAHTTPRGQRFLSTLFATFRNAFEMLAWSLEVDDGGGDDDLSDGDEEDGDDPRETKAALEEHIRAYLRMAPETERAFLLFHRHFVSDHRMVMMLVRYGDLVIGKRVERSEPNDWVSLDQAIMTAGFSRQGTASGRGSSCFLYTLLQLINDDENEDHLVVRLLRRQLSLDRIIPARGFLDAADPQLQSWVEHTYPNHTIQIWSRDPDSGLLMIRTTIGNGGTVVNMLLQGNHFTPLWP